LDRDVTREARLSLSMCVPAFWMVP